MRAMFLLGYLVLWLSCIGTSAYPAKRSYGGIPSRHRGLSSIVGGVDAESSEFPYQVAIGDDKMIYCGGVLIDKYWVVTARHCVVDKHGAAKDAETERIDVQVGADRINPHTVTTGDAQIIRAEKIYVTGTAYEDVALIKLSKAADLRHFIRIAEDDDRFMGCSCTIIGWGYTNKTANTRPATLQKATTTIVEWSKCTDTFSGLQNTEFDICAVSAYTSSCNGDSGGSLLCKDPYKREFVLFGVISAGTHKCGAGDPGIYKRVAYWKTWIRRSTNIAYL